MEIKVGGSKNKVRDVEPKIALGYIERSGVYTSKGVSIGRMAFSGSKGKTGETVSIGGNVDGDRPSGRTIKSSFSFEYLIDRWWKDFSKYKYKFADKRQLGSLSQEMGRTRTLERSINKHIPNKLEQLLNKRESLDRKSPHYTRSLNCVKRKIVDERRKLKEYKYEWKFRKRLVYTLSKSIIPSFTILKRDKYNVVQCKWRFMGKEQKRIHLGTMEAVGDLSDDVLRKRSLQIIQKKFAQPIDTITMKWIKAENERLKKWCTEMNYRVSND
jgi:hypothetical protein